MHKKVYAVYFLLSKGQYEEGQKAQSLLFTRTFYRGVTNIKALQLHMVVIAATESILPTFCFNSRWIN